MTEHTTPTNFLNQAQRAVDTILIFCGGYNDHERKRLIECVNNPHSFITTTYGFVCHEGDRSTSTSFNEGTGRYRISNGWNASLPEATTDQMIKDICEFSDLLFSKYVGEHPDPKKNKASSDEGLGRGTVGRLAIIFGLLESAEGERRSWLFEFADKIYTYMSNNSQFQTMLARKSEEASKVREKLAEFKIGGPNDAAGIKPDGQPSKLIR